MLRRTVKFVAVASLLALPAVAQSQTCAQQGACSVSALATLTIPTIVRMQIPSTTITLNGASITDISGGAAVVPGTFGDVSVSANSAWNLTVGVGATTNWTYTGSAGGIRPVSTLQYSVNSAAFTNIAASTQIASAAGASNGTLVNVQFQATLPADYSDAANRAGSYALTVGFTLTAP